MSSFMVSPADTPAELEVEDLHAEASLKISGEAITSVTANTNFQFKKDAKRYTKLLKRHIEAYNSHYKVTVTTLNITIWHESGGNGHYVGIFRYNAGTSKALYCLLATFNYNMEKFSKHLKENVFVPFPADSYVTCNRTPDPGDRLIEDFRLVDGKWV